MTEGVFAFLMFAGISTWCWAMVLKPRLRQRMSKPAWWFYRVSEQDRANWDAMTLAGSLVGALLFSMITVVFAVVALYRLFTA